MTNVVRIKTAISSASEWLNSHPHAKEIVVAPQGALDLWREYDEGIKQDYNKKGWFEYKGDLTFTFRGLPVVLPYDWSPRKMTWLLNISNPKTRRKIDEN